MKNNLNLKNVLIITFLILGIVLLTLVFIQKSSNSYFNYKLTNKSSTSNTEGAKRIEGKVRKDVKPKYDDLASIRVANFVPPRSLENVYDSLKLGLADKALNELDEMEKKVLTPEEKIVVKYTRAQIYFTYKDFQIARKLFFEFINENPIHPLVENAKNAIEFIDNYEKHMEKYKKFEDELK